jgi:hypothetical protein
MGRFGIEVTESMKATVPCDQSSAIARVQTCTCLSDIAFFRTWPKSAALMALLEAAAMVRSRYDVTP